MKKRLIAWMLAIALLLTSGSTVLAVDSSAAARQQRLQYHTVYINPLYADVTTEDELRGQPRNTTLGVPQEQYSDAEEVLAAQLRKGMLARQETITLYLKTSEYNQNVMRELFDQAVCHTGVAKQGDYLLWQYAGWEGSMSGYVDGMMYYFTLTYTFTYYTTAEQEKAVDNAVESLREELQLNEKSDYEKICAIYDYICSNVVYDTEHLYDDSYKLKYTAYAALINRTAVCQGYSVLFYRLALEEGINCRFLSGVAGNEAHSWNIVKLGGRYYNVDATWDAGTTQNEWFLKCDADFAGHERNPRYATEAFAQAYPMDTLCYAERLDGHAHIYSEPRFEWTQALDGCTVVLRCTMGDCIERMTCAITDETIEPETCTQDGTIRRTATAELDGESWSDHKKLKIKATGHVYGAPEFRWSDDLHECTAVFPCEKCGETVERSCTVERTAQAGSCTQSGTAEADASVLFEEAEYTDHQTAALPALGHEYTAPEFRWSEDLTECTAVFTCVREDDVQEIPCTVTLSRDEPVCETDGADSYTAEAVLMGTSYTDVRSIPIPALGHSYQAPVFEWSDDLSHCNAAFTCARCGGIIRTNCTVDRTVEPAGCTESGTAEADASVTFEEQEYSDHQTAVLPALGHEHAAPEFRWEDDLTECTAVFTCVREDDIQEIACTITEKNQQPNCEREGTHFVTATAEWDGTIWINTKQTTLPVKAHVYGKPEFQWNQAKDACTAVFRCENCLHTETVDCIVTIGEDRTATAECTFAETVYTDTTALPEIRVEDVFTDISAKSWFRDYVQYVYDHGIMKGMTKTTFSPNTPLTRAQIARILYTLAGEPKVTADSLFSDVAPKAWYYKPVIWANESGIVNGYTDGTFRPNRNVSRQELAVMLYNNAGKPEAEGTLDEIFADSASIASWAAPAVLWAYQNGVVSGISGTNGMLFSPRGDATRAQAATMMMRYCQLN